MSIMNAPVQAKIVRAISRRGKITFAEYTKEALFAKRSVFCEGGYYTSGRVDIGPGGHFNTEPQRNAPHFGHGIAKQLYAMWQAIGKPETFHAVEMGAGIGNMARDILSYASKNQSDFYKCLKYVIIEISQPLIEAQKSMINSAHWSHVKWVNASAIRHRFSLPVTGCFISNELVDTFPFHKIVYENGRLRERYVRLNGAVMSEVSGNLSSERLEQALKDRFGEHPFKEGHVIYFSLRALEWLETLAYNLKRGYVITIDYGAEDTESYLGISSEIGMYGGGVSDMEIKDPFFEPGKMDITTMVDFGMLDSFGGRFGLQKLLLMPQIDYFDRVLKTPLPRSDGVRVKVLIQAKNAPGI